MIARLIMLAILTGGVCFLALYGELQLYSKGCVCDVYMKWRAATDAEMIASGFFKPNPLAGFPPDMWMLRDLEKFVPWKGGGR